MMCSRWTHAHDGSDEQRTAALSRPMGAPGVNAVPEETVFGIVSRYHVRTGHQAAGDTLTDLLGKRTISLSTAFPSGVGTLCRRLALPVDSVLQLIDSHTVLPYFRPFIPALHYDRIAQNVANDFGGDSKISLGLLASRIGAADILRYCPACAEADLGAIGAATWYRAHQLPGVLICPYHGEPLMESFCLAQRLRRQQLFLPATAGRRFSCCRIAYSSAAAEASLCLVAKLSAQILSLGERSVDPTWLRNQYGTRLLEIGLASSASRIHQKEFGNEFASFWAGLQGVPPFSGLLTSCREQSSWLAGLCRTPRHAHHPLKHVLLIGFLAGDAISFFGAHLKMPVTTTSSLPMDNRGLAAGKMVELLKQSASVRHAASILNCSVNTLLVRAEKAGVQLKRRPKILNEPLRAQVRRALGAGDPIDVIVRAARLSPSTVNRLLGGDLVLQRERSTSVQNRRQSAARENMLAAIAANPMAGFTVLQTDNPADFSWLYRHDRQWLKAHLPVKAKATPNKSAVDWQKRDLWMAKRVEECAAEILNVHGKPVRVTFNEIGRRTEHESWLGKHLDKLPATNRVLHDFIESSTAFRERRILWWARELEALSPYAEVAVWKVARAAGTSLKG